MISGKNAGRMEWLPGTLAFLFISIPALYLGILLTESTDNQKTYGLNQLRSRLEQSLHETLWRAQDKEWLQHGFHLLKPTCDAQIQERLQRPNPFPLCWDMVACFVKSNGAVMAPKWSKPFPKVVFRRFWNDLKKGKAEPKNLPMYKSWFCSSISLFELSTLPDTPIERRSHSGEGLQIWSRNNDGSGLFLLLVLRKPLSTVLTEIIEKDPTRSQSIGLFNPTTGNVRIPGNAENLAPGVIKLALLRKTGYSEIQGFVLIDLWIQSDLCIFAVKGIPLGVPWKTWELPLLISVGCLLLFSALYKRYGGAMFLQMEIFPRVLVIFFGMSLVPLTFFTQSAWKSLKERELALHSDIHDENLKRLRKIDYTYEKWQRDLLETYRSLRDSFLGKTITREEFLKQVLPLKERKRLSQAEVRSINAELIATTNPKADLNQLLWLFSREIIAKYLNVALSVSDGLSQITRDFLMSPTIGLNWIIKQPDKLLPLQLGDHRIIWYWDVLPAKGDKAVVIHIFNFVNMNNRRFFGSHTPPGIFVFDRHFWNWLPEIPSLKDFEGLTWATLHSGKSGKIQMTDSNGSFLISAYPSTSLEGYCYLAFTDLHAVNQEVSNLKQWFFLLFCGSVLFWIACSWKFARLLLKPVAELSKGLKALEVLDYSFSFESRSTDELGQIGKSLESILLTFKERNLAENFQKTLIPMKPPEIPGYEATIFYEPVANLAGDYCDILPLDENRFLVVLGDVSGHGIAPALVAASVKALCVQMSQDPMPLLPFLMQINEIILKQFKRKRHMTMVIGILDTQTHVFTYAPAGQCCPIHKSQMGMRELGPLRLPLGFPPRKEYVTRHVSVNSGDVLFFYTDGIPEAIDSSKKHLGFSPILSLFQNLPMGISSDEVGNAVLKLYRDHIKGFPAGDDVTFLVLRRKSDRTAPSSDLGRQPAKPE